MSRTFFIIGNPSSVWMHEYIKEIHAKNKDEIYITVFDESSLKYKNDYDRLGVKLVILGKKSSRSEKIIKTIKLFNFALHHRKHNKFDIIEIHYPPHNFQSYILSWIIKLMNTKSFLMFWGSDLLPISKKDAKKLEKVICAVTKINRLSQHTYQVFNNFYGTKYDYLFTEKTMTFGTLALPYIDKLMSKMDKNQCKKKYGIPENRISVAVGYNGKRRQQHLLVLKELEKLEKEIKRKLFLIIHLAGLESLKYKEEINNQLKNTGIDYKVIYSTLDFEHISVMRFVTDIFIHAQTTDGLSGSMRECLYAGAIVLNPKWIVYHELINLGVKYIEYESFSKIGETIKMILNGDISIDILGNRKVIENNYSWDSVYKDWAECFNEIAEE